MPLYLRWQSFLYSNGPSRGAKTDGRQMKRNLTSVMFKIQGGGAR